ncbi:MAG: MFS transporter [Sphaerochaeta sp.]|nr:MFS transporter [Sphaerochaeta sp.]
MVKKKVVDMKIIMSCMLMLSIGFEMGGFQAVVREMSSYFSLGKIAMGVLVASQYVSIIVMPALFGRIADRVGKKRILVIFMCLFCLGTCLVGSSPWLPLTLASFFLIGAGFGVAESVCTALLSDQYGRDADRYINLSQAFFCIGAVIAPLFAIRLLPQWRWVFFVSAGICLISLVLLILESGFRVVISPPSSQLVDTSLFKSRLFIMLFCTMIIYVGLENGFGYFTESVFYESYASSLGSYALSLYWASMALSRILSSLSSQDLYKQLLHRFVVIALVFVGLYVSKSAYLFLFLCAAIGFSYGPIWSYIMSMAAGMYPHKSASVIGMISSGCGIGGALFPILMGAIVKYTPLGSGFLFLSASALLAALLVYGASYVARERSQVAIEENPELALDED